MFDVKKTIDEHGNEVTPSLEFNPGFVICVVLSHRLHHHARHSLHLVIPRHCRAPHPFKADIKPRSAQVMSLIRENRI